MPNVLSAPHLCFYIGLAGDKRSEDLAWSLLKTKTLIYTVLQAGVRAPLRCRTVLTYALTAGCWKP